MQSIVLTSVHADSPLAGSVAVAGDTWEVDDATDGAHDIDITADGLFTIDYTGTDREIFSHNLFDASASSYVGVGYVFINGPHGVVLDSVDPLSPLAGSVAVAGDYWEVSDQTTDLHDVNIFADGMFEIEYGGTDREIFTHDLFDASAAAFVGVGEVVVNNKAPNFGQQNTFPRSFAFRKDQAIAAIDLAADYAPDPEGDTVVAVALETLPAGLSVVSSVLQGTPTKYIAPLGYTIQWTDEYADTYTEEIILGVGGVSRFVRTIRDVDATRPVLTSTSVITVSQTQNNVLFSATDPQGHPGESVSGVAGYRVYRDGALISDQTGTQYNDTGRAIYTLYTYAVEAYDAAGNVSVKSTPITVRTLDQTAPTTPQITTTVPAAPGGGTSLLVALSTPATDAHSGIQNYQLEHKRTVDSTWITQNLTAAQFPRTISGLTQFTQYDTRCIARDNSNNLSAAYSAIKQATTLDITAPLPPTIAASSPSSSTISVALTALATDTGGSGVLNYRLEYKLASEPTNWTLVNDMLLQADFPRTISGLISNTSYNARVRARDVAGNVGNYSNIATASTQVASGAPVWSSVPTITFTQGTAANVSIAGYVVDPNNDPLIITKNAQALPGGGHIVYSSANKRFEYNGNVAAAVGFTDGHILTADDGAAPNQPPVWNASVNQSLTVNTAFSLNLDTLCADPEAQPLTYTVITGTLPAGLTQSGARGQTISGTPTTAQTLSITFRATD